MFVKNIPGSGLHFLPFLQHKQVFQQCPTKTIKKTNFQIKLSLFEICNECNDFDHYPLLHCLNFWLFFCAVLRYWRKKSIYVIRQKWKCPYLSSLREGSQNKKTQKYGLWPYSADPPPNLNYGLFTPNFFELFFPIDFDSLSFKMNFSQETNIEKYVWSLFQNTKIIPVTLS